MKHSEVIEKRNGLLELKGIKSAELNYAIAENIERAEKAIKPLAKQEEELENILKEFSEKRREIGEKYAKDEKGDVQYKQSVSGDGKLVQTYDIPKDKLKAFQDEVSKLKVKYKKEIKEYDTEMAKYLKFIEETESPYKPMTIKMAHVPSDITTEQMKIIFHFIRKKENE